MKKFSKNPFRRQGGPGRTRPYADSEGKAGTVAYLVGQYPAVSHTFIDREVQGLRGRGFVVETGSLRPADPAHLLTSHDRDEDRRTWVVLPPPILGLLRDHASAAISHPRRYVSTLMLATSLGSPGLRGLLWKLFYFAEAARVAAWMRRIEADHLHAHFANSASWVALLASRLNGRTWSFTMHGPTEFDEVQHFALPAKVEDAAFVACIGDYCRSQLMRVSDPDQWHKLLTVRCGVDPGRYTPSPEPARSMKDPVRILSVGRLVPDKGQRVLLDAVALLVADGMSLEVTFVGDGPDRGALEAQARSLGVSGSVRFVGNVGQDALPSIYQANDVFVMSSFAEGIPVVLMEAMASGLPVVSTAVMGIGELVAHRVSGLLVPPARADLIAGAVHEIAGDPPQWRAAGLEGRARVLESFSFPAVVDPLADALQRVAR